MIIDLNKKYRHVRWTSKDGYSNHGALIKEKCGLFFKYCIVYCKGKLIRVKEELEKLDYREVRNFL